jgi:hypothetical protein
VLYPLSYEGRGRGRRSSLSAGDQTPFIFVVMEELAGPSSHHELSAQDARRRILSFFNTQLQS